MNNSILKVIADNPSLQEELRKVFEKEFDVSNLSDKCSDEELGQRVRARIVGLDVIESVFRKINEYKSIPDSPKKVNKAR